MNGFILVFGMVLVLAVERRFAADRAAVGRPHPQPTVPPRGGVPTRSRTAVQPMPAPWPSAHPQPTAPPVVRYPSAAGNPPARGRRQSRGRVPGRSPMAKCSRNAFPSVRQWQYIDAMRSPASGRGKISPWCVPGRRSVAAFSLHAFPKGPRTGKTPVRGNISPPCIQNELASARHARRASEKPCKRAFGDTPREDLATKGPFSLRGPLESCTARGSCRRSALAGRRALCVEGRGAGLRKRTPYCCRRSRVPARHLVAFCGGSLSRSKRLALRYAAPAVTIPCRDRPRPAADAPPSFGRQRLPMTQRTKNGQHFAGRFWEVMS